MVREEFQERLVELRQDLLVMLRGDEDLTQDTLLIAWKKIDTLESGASIWSWLISISRLCRRNQLRATTRLKKRLDRYAPEKVWCEDKTELEPLDLSKLDRMLKQYYFDGIGYDEIAASLGISYANATQRMARARQKLKGKISA